MQAVLIDEFRGYKRALLGIESPAKSMVDILLERDTEEEKDGVKSFATPEEFLTAWKGE